MKKKVNKKTIQIISIVTFLAVVIGLTILAIPLVRSMSSEEGMHKVSEYLDKYNGFVGVLIFVAVQALQVVIAIIPPIQVVGGALFGWFFGGVLSFLGVVIGSFAIYSMVEKFGAPLAEAFVDERQMKKFKFLQDEHKLTGILMILYFIPGIPKDVITYIVPLTKVSKKDFFMYVIPARLPAVMLSTVFGNNLGKGNFGAAIVIFAIIFVVGLVGFFFKDTILNKIKQHRKSK